jgi:hypothetical protein
MSTLVSRDPFAREELYRTTVEAGNQTCSWCGQTRVIAKTGNKFLFQYFIKRDGVIRRQNVIEGLFCSINCMRTHHALREG